MGVKRRQQTFQPERALGALSRSPRAWRGLGVVAVYSTSMARVWSVPVRFSDSSIGSGRTLSSPIFRNPRPAATAPFPSSPAAAAPPALPPLTERAPTQRLCCCRHRSPPCLRRHLGGNLLQQCEEESGGDARGRVLR
jgi:hypothetical protein